MLTVTETLELIQHHPEATRSFLAFTKRMEDAFASMPDPRPTLEISMSTMSPGVFDIKIVVMNAATPYETGFVLINGVDHLQRRAGQSVLVTPAHAAVRLADGIVERLQKRAKTPTGAFPKP